MRMFTIGAGRAGRLSAAAVVAVAVVLLAVLVASGGTAAHAASGSPSVTVTPNTNLASGQTVTVAITGFVPGSTVYGVECDQKVVTGGSAYCNSTNVAVIAADSNGSGSTSFAVTGGSAFVSANGQGVCDSTHPCYLAASDQANANAIAALQFAAASTPTQTSTTPTPTTTTTASTPSTTPVTTPVTPPATTTPAVTTTTTASTTTTTTTMQAALGVATATPSTHLRSGEKVTVSVSKFPANAAVFGVECDARVLASGNDGWCNSKNVMAITTNASGKGHSTITLTTGAAFKSANGKGKCDAQHECYVAVTTEGSPQTTNGIALVQFGLATKTHITAAHRTVKVGTPEKVTVKVVRAGANGAFGGTVTLRAGKRKLETKTLSAAGAATFNPKLGAGKHTLTASYSGNANYVESSAGVAVTVTPKATR